MNHFQNILQEMAPPSDWDLSTFDKSFAAQVRYATEKAKRIGSGSSRVVFEIPYQGRTTVLKIAKNKKGLAQNEVEGDWSLYNYYPDILIPLIDKDTEHDEPTWLHFEKANKLTSSKFKSMTGFTFNQFAKVLMYQHNKITATKSHFNYIYNMSESLVTKILETELLSDVVDMCVCYDILPGDFGRIANWGEYQGRPVIIDVGFTKSVATSHYGFRI